MICNKKTEAVKTVLTYVFLTVMVVISVFPIVWMLDSSLKGSSEIYSSPPTFTIHEVTMENYVRVLFDSGIPRAFLNSVIVSVTATLTTLTLGCLAGYGSYRSRPTGRRMLYVGLFEAQKKLAAIWIIRYIWCFPKSG